MRRYWIEKEFFSEDRVVISGDSFHHILGVCKQDVGSKFEVLTEDSKAYFVEVVEKTKKSAIAKIIDERNIEPLPEPYIHLCLSVPKFQTADLIMEKAVELGTYRVRPFVSDFSFVRSVSKVSDSKKMRWKKIVKGATQQCGRGELMAVDEPCQLADLLEEINRSDDAVGLFPYEGESSKDIKQALAEVSKKAAKHIWVFVGSEGGFSDHEVELFKKYGLDPVTLGPQVLRVETACLAMISVIKYEFGMMSS